MSFFQAEPPRPDAISARVGVLLCNLGTPERADVPSVRSFLAEFLSDPRVVELPRWLWKPILHGFILPFRPKHALANYQKIWMQEGSPLMVYSQRQASMLQGWLGERGHEHVRVRLAMRYGQPSIAGQLDAFKAEGVQHVLILPLYPQYSGSTTASVMDAVAAWMQGVRHLPEIRFIRSFFKDEAYIQALARLVREHWQKNGRGGRLLMSFHGLPQRMVDQGDPYDEQCMTTASALAHELDLKNGEWALTFQSRFGRAKWLEPATQATLERWAASGVKRVDVICPGFVSDCLETLEEIALQGRDAFLQAGGEQFHALPCLNNRADWIACLANLTQRHVQGWPSRKKT